MSHPIDAFGKLLGESNSGWQEISVQLASEKLREFSAADWRALAEQVLRKPEYWQERCAEALGLLGSEAAEPLLQKMLDSEHLQVASIAASELDNLSARLPKELHARLVEIYRYLDSRQSPRKDDVKRLLSQLV